METKNTNMIANLMGSASRVSAKGFESAGKETGAPEFAPFLRNETRPARNEQTVPIPRTGASSNQTYQTQPERLAFQKQDFHPGTRTEPQPVRNATGINTQPTGPQGPASQTPPNSEHPTGLEQALSRLNENNASPEARQQLAALWVNGGLLPGQTQGSGQDPDTVEAAGTPAVSTFDALTQLLNQLKNHPGAALADLLPPQTGGSSLEALIGQLQQLDLDPETLNRLVELLNGDAGERGPANAFLQALNGLLQALQNANAPANGEDAPVQAVQTNANNASVLEQKILAALVKAGLSETEAQKILKQAQGGNSGQTVDGRIVLTQLAKNLAKSRETGNTEAPAQTQSSELKPTASIKEQAFSLEDKKSGQDMKALSSLARERGDAKPVSNLTHEGKAQANTHNAATPNAPVAPKAAGPAPVNTVPAPHTVTAGQEGASPLAGSTGAAQAGDKAAPAFRPVMAETYSPRGGVEKPVATQIIEKVMFRGSGHQREVHIKLDPPSLGTVRMNISSKGETVRATLVAENHAVKHAIESSLPQLRDSMQSQGMKIDSFTVLVGGNNAGQHAHQRPDGIHPFRPFDTAHDSSQGQEGGEEALVFHRPPFWNDSQTISLFA